MVALHPVHLPLSMRYHYPNWSSPHHRRESGMPREYM
jgi:hypothetical protein